MDLMDALVQVAHTIRPIYKSPMRIEKNLFSKNRMQWRAFKEKALGLVLPYTHYSLWDVLSHTVRRTIYLSSTKYIAYIEHALGTPSPDPTLWVSTKWINLMKRLDPSSFSTLAHELFHVFYYLSGLENSIANYLKDPAAAEAYEEYLALSYERLVLIKMKAYNRLKELEESIRAYRRIWQPYAYRLNSLLVKEAKI